MALGSLDLLPFPRRFKRACESVTLLLDFSSDPNATNDLLYTAPRSLSEGHSNVAEILLKGGADPSRRAGMAGRHFFSHATLVTPRLSVPFSQRVPILIPRMKMERS